MNTLESLLNAGIIVVLRNIPSEKLPRVAESLIKGGIKAAEVTFIQDGDPLETVRAIDFLVNEYADILTIGAGTVLSPTQLNLACDAGAKYIVSPNTDDAIIKRTKKLGLVSMPGGFTPSEIVRAHSLGADIIKVFPADIGGAKYIKSLKAPLKHIRLAAVGGVTPETLPEFIKAGAEAFGISTGIIRPDALENGEYGEIQSRASMFTSIYNNLQNMR